jgi:cytochrome c553
MLAKYSLAGYPRLAGLSADYLLRQLNDFADNNRENELMAPIAKSLSPAERKAVAAYYASVSSAQAEEPKQLNQVDVTRGAVVANEGHWSGDLPACLAYVAAKFQRWRLRLQL